MDYINYVKESPYAGYIGYGGGIGGLSFRSASGADFFGPRGWFGGGAPGGLPVNTMQYITIQSTGNATDGGDLATAVKKPSGVGGGGRILFAGGNTQTDNDKHFNQAIQVHTASNTSSNATNFGNLTYARAEMGACSDGTRGVFAAGRGESNFYAEDYSAVMDYVTIATDGNASNFGWFGWPSGYNVNAQTKGNAANAGDTRGVWAGGMQPGLPFIGSFYYVDIQVTSNTTTGIQELTTKSRFLASCSNNVRGLWAGGDVQPSPGYTNRIEWMTIANMSSTTDFGDLTATAQYHSGLSDGTGQRGVFGPITTGNGDALDYITIDSAGNATDFGDLVADISRLGAASG